MFLYLITNMINGKAYVGQTTRSIKWRWMRHRQGVKSKSVLHDAIKKYGAENFKVEQLAMSCSINCLNHLERLAIRSYNTLVPSGYNLKDGGDNGFPHAITRKKMSEAHKRLPPMSLESRQKLSNSLKGRKFSAEHRAKLSAAFKGNRRAKGAVKTPEMRAAISARNKGYVCSSELREKRRLRMLGNTIRQGMTAWNKGLKLS